MKQISIYFVIILIFLSGCSTKRNYFEPKKDDILGSVEFSGKLKSSLKDTTISTATLKNGQILTDESGLIDSIKLEKNETLIGQSNGVYFVSNVDGNFKILDGQNSIIFEKYFPSKILSASFDGEQLALVSIENSIYLVDLDGDTLYQKSVGDALVHNSKVASPKFLVSMVIFPTLDGKLLVVDREYLREVKDFIISSEMFFNNIIFFEIINESMYVATGTGVKVISPYGVKDYSANIKDVVVHNGFIYLFTKEGNIEILDANLDNISERNFKFAMFNSVIFADKYIYMLEKNGYLIITDENLNRPKIYKLKSGRINSLSFSTNSAFYSGDRILNLDDYEFIKWYFS